MARNSKLQHSGLSYANLFIICKTSLAKTGNGDAALAKEMNNTGTKPILSKQYSILFGVCVNGRGKVLKTTECGCHRVGVTESRQRQADSVIGCGIAVPKMSRMRDIDGAPDKTHLIPTTQVTRGHGPRLQAGNHSNQRHEYRSLGPRTLISGELDNQSCLVVQLFMRYLPTYREKCRRGLSRYYSGKSRSFTCMVMFIVLKIRKSRDTRSQKD
ncbi:hypothetical protein Syun_018162 [Stephania yunnanensis]|uniref:Uncharacterized protein n=1 Tax=Stephania yunnanensis TaxID=152371 RepID=A0AAP0ISD9_9MAGN